MDSAHDLRDVTDHIVIHERFRGPPGSANGGYTCGRVAAYVGNPAEVTLRSRPPLDEKLDVKRDGDRVNLLHQQTLVAEGVHAEFSLQIPTDVSLDVASEVAGPVSPVEHPFPECFVCGPLRNAGDGLCIYPGKIPGRDLFGAPWVPDGTLSQDDSSVDDTFVWAALDCPSGFAASLLGLRSPIILGRLAAQIIEPVVLGEPLVVVGWPIDRDGRKLFAGTAILSGNGDVKAFARATWIELQ